MSLNGRKSEFKYPCATFSYLVGTELLASSKQPTSHILTQPNISA